MMRTALTTVLMLAVCWPAWIAGGWLIEAMALTEFGLIGRSMAVFVVLSLAEAAWQRLRISEGKNHG